MKSITTGRVLVLVAACQWLFPATLWAGRSNPPAGRNGSIASGGTTCAQCHGGTPGSGSVQILGTPTHYEREQIYDLTVRIADSAQVGAGFQISVEDAGGTHVGTLLLSDAVNTQFNAGDPSWVNHTSVGVDNSVASWTALGNAAEYDVRWQAPSGDAGPITFFVAGVAINDNSAPSGDPTYLTSETSEFAGAVPAASQWGMVVMGLILLGAGTLIVRRRQSLPHHDSMGESSLIGEAGSAVSRSCRCVPRFSI